MQAVLVSLQDHASLEHQDALLALQSTQIRCAELEAELVVQAQRAERAEQAAGSAQAAAAARWTGIRRDIDELVSQAERTQRDAEAGVAEAQRAQHEAEGRGAKLQEELDAARSEAAALKEEAIVAAKQLEALQHLRSLQQAQHDAPTAQAGREAVGGEAWKQQQLVGLLAEVAGLEGHIERLSKELQAVQARAAEAAQRAECAEERAAQATAQQHEVGCLIVLLKEAGLGVVVLL
jgi:hypothetical protein